MLIRLITRVRIGYMLSSKGGPFTFPQLHNALYFIRPCRHMVDRQMKRSHDVEFLMFPERGPASRLSYPREKFLVEFGLVVTFV